MADRVTQLQLALGALANQMCDSVGVLHMEHEKYLTQVNGPAETERIAQQISEQVNLFTEAILISSANIDTLINSLPPLHASSYKQEEAFAAKQAASDEAVMQLRLTVDTAEAKLVQVRAALQQLSDDQYKIVSLTDPDPNEAI